MNAPGIVQPIDIGATVVGADGQKLGTVEYVVVRPDDLQVTNIVISTGAIAGRDVVVPVQRIRDVLDGKVQLSVDKEGLKQYPDYIEIEYDKPPSGWEPPEWWYYPAASMLWPAGTDYNPQPSALHINAPPGTLGLREGMPVETVDGHKVGSVDALEADVATGEIKGFVVKHGLLFKRDTDIPAGAVMTIRDGKVILALKKEEAELLEKGQSER